MDFIAQPYPGDSLGEKVSNALEAYLKAVDAPNLRTALTVLEKRSLK